MSSYQVAQRALADLKSAVYEVLRENADSPMSNAEIGKQLGIYGGHVGHEGHISRTVLALMESEHVVEQDPETRRWLLRIHASK